MLDQGSNNELPPIPAKRYFTIGEVSDLCLVKPHVLRYWEQEFPNLKPVKRRGNRRYYQRHDVLVIRQIRGLLYDQGFTIGGARQRLENELLKRAELESKSKSDSARSIKDLGSSAEASFVYEDDFADDPHNGDESGFPHLSSKQEARLEMIRELRQELERVLSLLQN